MRGGRSLVVLLALALGLGAYIYFIEAERDPSGTETLEQVFEVEEASAIDWMEVQTDAGEVTTLEKSGDDWRLVAPVTAPADAPAASAIADALATIDIVAVLDENPTDLTQYGLEPARATVAFRTAGVDTLHRLKIGNRTPTGSDIYAQVEGDPRLLLVAAYREDTLNRTTFELRDKRVLDFAREDVDRITIEPASGPDVTLAREDGDWRLTEPTTARADFSPVDSLISRVDQARMSSIVNESGEEPTAAELRTFGLDRPRLVATFGAGSNQARLAIGGDAEAATVYARDLSRPLVFTVEESLLTDLTRQPADLRVKDVFDFTTFSATGIEITADGTTRTFAKSAPPPAATDADAEADADGEAADGDAADATPASPPPAEVWSQTAPDPAAVNQTAMTDLLNTLSSLRADSFTERAPAVGQTLEVVVRAGDAASPGEERVTLRKSGETAYALVDGEPGAAVIPTADFDRAVDQLRALAGTE
jgi:hypothetical protein